jgi:tRNA-Thr(GGU) m(6)t(6)A37 methyltransferase TsaA
MTLQFEPIGTVSSPYAEKFGIPRQPGLVNAARSVIRLNGNPLLREAARDLDGFSHLWVIFVFHEHLGHEWNPRVRPPRLGGARKVGVLATRSPHRPNPIGLSVVRLERVDLDAPGGPEIHVRGADLLDGTPVLDVKPYIAYADAIPDATGGWIRGEEREAPLEVSFSDEARAQCEEHEMRHPGLRALIEQTLAQDPRPAFRAAADSDSVCPGEYDMMLLDLDVRFEAGRGSCRVTRIIVRGQDTA